MDLFLAGALTLVSSPLSIGIFFAGLIGGLLFGAIPGVSMLTLAAIFLPFSGLLSASDAIMFYSVLYCSGTYGGAVTAILFNIPGAPENAPDRLRRLSHDQAGHGRQGDRRGSAVLGLRGHLLRHPDDARHAAPGRYRRHPLRPAGDLRPGLLRHRGGVLGRRRDPVERLALGAPGTAAGDRRARPGGRYRALHLRLRLPPGRAPLHSGHPRLLRRLRGPGPGGTPGPRLLRHAQVRHLLPEFRGILAAQGLPSRGPWCSASSPASCRASGATLAAFLSYNEAVRWSKDPGEVRHRRAGGRGRLRDRE